MQVVRLGDFFFFPSPGLGLGNWNLNCLGCLGMSQAPPRPIAPPPFGGGEFLDTHHISAWLEIYVDQVDIHVPLPFECCD